MQLHRTSVRNQKKAWPCVEIGLVAVQVDSRAAKTACWLERRQKRRQVLPFSAVFKARKKKKSTFLELLYIFYLIYILYGIQRCPGGGLLG